MHRIAASCLLFCTLLAALLLPMAPARAQAIDDHANIDPTLWQVWSGQTGGQIDAVVAQGYRIIDIRSDDQFGSTFTVTYVANNGSYGIGWWYLIGVDANGLSQFLAQNTARLVRVAAWDDGNGGARFAAIMVPNGGASARTSWWYSGVSLQTFYNHALANNARPICLAEYQVGTTTFAAGAMIANTGADQRLWWLYAGMSFQDIGQNLGQTQSRLYSLQQAPNGTFTGIFVQDGVGPWWYWVGLGASSVLDTANNLGARVHALQRIGADSYLALMLRNDNDLERRVGDLMRGHTDGAVGVYLKRVNGPVLAALNSGRQFEPASTFKTLMHYHAMDQVRLGNIGLGTNLTVFTGSVNCLYVNNPVNESLSNVLRAMMENSDNARTYAVESRFGRASINATAQQLGLVDTVMNHTLGCGVPHNWTTLRDLGRLHELVANGSLGSQRADFESRMLEFGDSYAGGALNTVLVEEATAAGLSATQYASFRANCRQVFKGGSYGGNGLAWRCWGSWIALPFFENSSIQLREYVTGSFVDSSTNASNADLAFNRGAAEVLRDEVRAAMQSWWHLVPGEWSNFGTGCGPIPSLRPVHLGTPPAPAVGGPLVWELANARSNTFCMLLLGYSNTQHAGQPLPIDLAAYGMPTCQLHVEIVNSFAGFTNTAGRATFATTMPLQPSLVGMRFYTQYAAWDATANQTGVAWSNGRRLILGGER